MFGREDGKLIENVRSKHEQKPDISWENLFHSGIIRLLIQEILIAFRWDVTAFLRVLARSLF